LLKCDPQEDDTQTVVIYLVGLGEMIAYVIKLHLDTTLDGLSSLAHRVKMQRKINRKGEVSNPPQRTYHF